RQAPVRSRGCRIHRTSVGRAARALSALQRGLSWRVGRIGRARGAVQRGDPPHGAAGRVSAGGIARTACPRRAHVSPRGTAAGAQLHGAARGLEELAASADRERLDKYPFYPASMGELELRRGNRAAAREHFSAALALARNAAERRFLEKRMRASVSERS